MAEPFDIKKWASGLVDPVTWSKSIQYMIMICAVLFVAFAIKNTFFPTKSNVNKPITIVTPFARVEKDGIKYENTQVTIEKEKSFEVGGGVAGLRYDNKDGVLVGLFGKYKF